jgi:hypothetical protein
MNTGKTLFAQLMDFLPWSTFSRIVSRYDGDRAVRTLSCAAFRVMAFAQLTYRESLRDIEACLSAQAGKLYHMGFRDRVHRSTLADANEARDWRIYAEFAQQLIGQARPLYAGAATRSMRWTRRPSICGCRYSRGRIFVRPRARPTDRTAGLICDQTIALDGPQTRRDYCASSGSTAPRKTR